MIRLIDTMQADGYAQPVLVLSNDPNASGLAKARERGVEAVGVDHRPFGKDRAAFEAELLKPLLAAEPDVVCLAGFMRVLTPDFVRQFEGRMLNIHPSLLPKYPGLHTHQRALDAGDSQAGCTVHEVTAELDAGPVLGQGRVVIQSGDTVETLASRVLAVEHQLYPAVLRRYVTGNRDLVSI